MATGPITDANCSATAPKRCLSHRRNPQSTIMNLFLIGYRATGKTTVAGYLAGRLDWRWIDSDDEIESVAGKSIADIFAADGQERFRDIESQVVERLAQGDRRVIALGGGAVLRPQNRLFLRRGGKVVWLQALPETINKRLAGDDTTAARRPDLTDTGGLTEIVQLLGQRTPIYQECADLVIDTEGKPAPEVAEEILGKLNLATDKPDPD